MTCDECLDALSLLVLGALEPEEAALVSGHLADCGECAVEQRRLWQVVRMLPWALPEVEPWAGLEGRLRSRVAASSNTVPLRLKVRRWQAWAPAAAAAALVLTLGVSVTTAVLVQRQQTLQASLDAANRQVEGDRTALGFATGPGRTLELHTIAGGGSASGLFRMDSNTGQVALVVNGLAAAPPGKVYQGWMRRGSDRISIGVFAPHESGAPVVLTLSGQPALLLSQVDGFGVTLEPVGGSPWPSAPPLMTS